MKSFINRILNRNLASDRIVNVASYVRDEWIKQKAKMIDSGSRVLDAGAGQCPYRHLFSHCDYKAQDFAQYKGSETESWQYKDLDYVSDITNIPVADNSFDVVICTEVLEHLPRPIEALKELSRVLDHGGRLLLTAPLSSGIHQTPYFFYGGYSPQFYSKFLSENGLEIKEIKPICGLMKHVAQEIYRAGQVLDSRSHRKMSAVVKYILMCWLPVFLAKLDDEVFVEEFTIGYMVEAQKK